tara:strand:+ start:554 stop:892 length:339 start_codon:yes stop_codon:yes gene_type:complete
MIWPPVKAWTSNIVINGQIHFVAINYGGKLLDRWVIMMSVIDSRVVLKISYSELFETSNWKCGWDENDFSNLAEVVDHKSEITTIDCLQPSIDSGLTVPITKSIIRPWFCDN